MSITSRICTFLLLLAVLFTAISAQDDAISLSTFIFNDSSTEDSLTPLPHFQNSDYDPSQASSFDWLETLHVGAVCSLHLELSSVPIHRNDSVGESSLSVTSPVGRAPPALFF
jgi:hypothetical protein